jgi:hypothetical protein
MAEDVKPCPFCGVEMPWLDDDGTGYAEHPYGNSCWLDAHVINGAIELFDWNRRAGEPVLKLPEHIVTTMAQAIIDGGILQINWVRPEEMSNAETPRTSLMDMAAAAAPDGTCKKCLRFECGCRAQAIRDVKFLLGCIADAPASWHDDLSIADIGMIAGVRAYWEEEKP